MTNDVSLLKKSSKIQVVVLAKGNTLGVVPRVRSYAQAQYPK